MNQNHDEDAIEIDLLHICQILWEKIWMILAAVVGGGLILFLIARFCISPVYLSSITMYVNNSSAPGSSSYVYSTTELNAARSLVDTFLVILKTNETMDEVIKATGTDYTTTQLLRKVSGKAVDSTNSFQITVTDGDPETARELAEAIGNALPGRIASIVEGSDVRFVSHARVNPNRISPSYTKYTVLGAFLAALAVCLIIVIRDMMDDAIRENDYLTKTYDLPVLAVIPDLMSEEGLSHYSYSHSQKTSEKES